jgi:hypothetical protein
MPPRVRYLVVQSSDMQGEKRERWHQISEQMETEQNPDRFIELSKELLRLLDEKRRRLNATRQPKEDDLS